MCRHHRPVQIESRGPFEGETIRLSGAAEMTQSHARRHDWGYIWHFWWLIWPLMGLIKWLAPIVASGLATLSHATLSIPLLVPVALIVIGIVLLRRR